MRWRSLLLTAVVLFAAGFAAWKGYLAHEAEAAEQDCFPPWDGNQSCDLRKLAPADPSAPNIVLIVIDSWRFDHFSPEITPKLWNRARDGIRYQNYFANAGYTRASAASYLSGRLPIFAPGDQPWRATGFRHLFPPNTQPRINNLGAEIIPPDFKTFPELLRKTGAYLTILATQNQIVSHWSGYGGRHWDRMINLSLLDYETGGDALVDTALTLWKRIRVREKRAPVFLYVHLMDAHQPYNRKRQSEAEVKRQERYFNTAKSDDPPARAQLLLWMKKEYRKGVAFADEQAARLAQQIENLERRNRNTIFLVTADHGEMFDETGEVWNIGHEGHIPREVIHVPLMIFGRGIRAGVDEELRQGIDLAPTILELAGALPSPDMKGENLFTGIGRDRLTSFSPFETATISREDSEVKIDRRPLEDDGGRYSPQDAWNGIAR